MIQIAGIFGAALLLGAGVVRGEAAATQRGELVKLPAGEFHVGKETTRVMGPRRKDGTVDYVRLWNEEEGRGVAMEQNAGVVLARAVGPLFATDRGWAAMWGEWKLEPPVRGEWMPFRFYIGLHPEFKGKATAEDVATILRDGWKENAAVRGWFKERGEVVDEMEAGAELPGFYLPTVVTDGSDCAMSEEPVAMSEARGLVDAILCRGLMRLADGDHAGYLRAMKAGMKWSRLLSKRSTLLYGLIAVGTEEAAVEACEHGVLSGKLTEKELGELADFLRGLKPVRELAEDVDTGERYVLLDFAQRCAKVGPKYASSTNKDAEQPAERNENGVDYDWLMRRFNEVDDRLIAAGREESFVKQREGVAAYRAYAEEQRKKYENKVTMVWDFGGYMAAQLMPDVGRAFTVERQMRLEEDLLVASVAMERYREKHAEYPKGIEELKGEFLREIPVDRFTGGSLRYVRVGKGYRLWSVGENLRDDGGVFDHAKKLDDVGVVGGGE